jgi:hypothetical protein
MDIPGKSQKPVKSESENANPKSQTHIAAKNIKIIVPEDSGES